MRWGCLVAVALAAAACASSTATTSDTADAAVTPGCGDGVIDANEECDDGRSAAGDGCSAGCTVEPGWACDGEPSTCTPICGDGVVSGQTCDDGGTDPGDGCDPACNLEDGWACSGEPSLCVPSQVCPTPTTVVDVGQALHVSCKAYRDAGFVGSGAYAIDVDLGGPAQPVVVLCDMTTDGGGWTVVTNNDNADSEPSGCQPRIATRDSFACGTLACDQDFALLVEGLSFSELVWAAYAGDLAVESYTYMKFDNPKTFPTDDGTWSMTADDFDQVIADWADKPRFSCGWFELPGFRRIANETPRVSVGGYSSNTVLTFIDENDSNKDPGRMSFTEASSSNGSVSGLDDFQDGWGCEERWEPRTNRGFSSFIMVR